MKSAQDLRRLLESIDRKGYPAYKDTRGSYDFTDYVLSIDHVQGDPFASPSKLSVFIPLQRAAYPSGYFDAPHKQTALEDYLVSVWGSPVPQHWMPYRPWRPGSRLYQEIKGAGISVGKEIC